MAAESYALESSIPVLRMLDEAKAKAFYVDYLGYTIEWEHRFRSEDEASPLYMQIRQGDSVIHLNGHAERDAPVAEVRIPVRGLANFCEHLRGKESGFEKPEAVDPRYEGKNTDMNIYDPSGNMLTFWMSKEEREA